MKNKWKKQFHEGRSLNADASWVCTQRLTEICLISDLEFEFDKDLSIDITGTKESITFVQLKRQMGMCLFHLR